MDHHHSKHYQKIDFSRPITPAELSPEEDFANQNHSLPGPYHHLFMPPRDPFYPSRTTLQPPIDHNLSKEHNQPQNLNLPPLYSEEGPTGDPHFPNVDLLGGLAKNYSNQNSGCWQLPYDHYPNYQSHNSGNNHPEDYLIPPIRISQLHHQNLFSLGQFASHPFSQRFDDPEASIKIEQTIQKIEHDSDDYRTFQPPLPTKKQKDRSRNSHTKLPQQPPGGGSHSSHEIIKLQESNEHGGNFQISAKHHQHLLGGITKEERKLKIQLYLEKRQKRTFTKKVAYDCRKKVADQRIRIKGRFVTREQALEMLSIEDKGYSVEEIKQMLKAPLDVKVQVPLD